MIDINSNFIVTGNQRVTAQHNIDTSIKFQPNTNDVLSPKHNILDTGDSLNGRNQTSDYYGTYAKT